MTNIWEFFLQTISVSITAAIVLIVKRIFEDKLSPRWQYGVWSILAVSLIIPANPVYNVLPRLTLWVEILKDFVDIAA